MWNKINLEITFKYKDIDISKYVTLAYRNKKIILIIFCKTNLIQNMVLMHTKIRENIKFINVKLTYFEILYYCT